ncbi:hypothetical protein B0H66DRAFT_535939 [Apodospora peruviana]|uniref:Uncharacterized protein n=1 Tax=Apodospora peruviana TaxID=516989 RepID=A0AAE0M1X7_9PEZI|nr:hypothetical protein B0H66DRAFT_535939 [Apodospora peruviana]
MAYHGDQAPTATAAAPRPYDPRSGAALIHGTGGRGGRPSKPSQQHRRQLPESHFDPDELRHRLHLVLADQRAHAERKRRTRAEGAGQTSTATSSSSAEATAIAPKTGATTIITDININNKNNDDPNGTTANPRRDGGARQRSHDGGRRPESLPTAKEQTPADLITELRRSKSSARRKSSKLTLSVVDGNAEYHHVPKEAAKQFTRTTTQENMRNANIREGENLVHQMSKRALKVHKENEKATVPLAPGELNRALRNTQAQRERALDQERERENKSSHTFQGEIARILPAGHQRHHSNSAAARRNSTGSVDGFERSAVAEHNRRSLIQMEPVMDDSEEDVTPPEEEVQKVPPHEHRVDWSQSDESGRRQPKLLLSPLLRKADSWWALRGRLGSKGAASQDEKEAGSPPHESGSKTAASAVAPATATTPKSPKAGFFAKFKR